jgi:hypothetical protein
MDTTPLRDNNIVGIAFDDYGNVWVATANAGLYRFKKPW